MCSGSLSSRLSLSWCGPPAVGEAPVKGSLGTEVVHRIQMHPLLRRPDWSPPFCLLSRALSLLLLSAEACRSRRITGTAPSPLVWCPPAQLAFRAPWWPASAAKAILFQNPLTALLIPLNDLRFLYWPHNPSFWGAYFTSFCFPPIWMKITH